MGCAHRGRDGVPYGDRGVVCIDARSAPLVVAAGASVLVAGSSVYGYKGGVAAGIKAIHEALD